MWLEYTDNRLSARNGGAFASALRNSERCEFRFCKRVEASHLRGRLDEAHQAPDLDYQERQDRSCALSHFPPSESAGQVLAWLKNSIRSKAITRTGSVVSFWRTGPDGRVSYSAL